MNPSMLLSDPQLYFTFSPDSESSSPADASTSLSHGRKRRRTSRLSAAHLSPEIDLEGIQGETDPTTSIDLTESEEQSSLSKTLAKQREDAIKAQRGPGHEEGRSVLTAFKCPVCLDPPVDATSTTCGHLFCHKCIIDTLKSSEESRRDSSGKAPKGICPICRKALTRNDIPGPRRNLIPLQFKLTTKKRNEVRGSEA